MKWGVRACETYKKIMCLDVNFMFYFFILVLGANNLVSDCSQFKFWKPKLMKNVFFLGLNFQILTYFYILLKRVNISRGHAIKKKLKFQEGYVNVTTMLSMHSFQMVLCLNSIFSFIDCLFFERVNMTNF